MQNRLHKLAQDRLIWFVVFGLLLFGTDQWLQTREQQVIKIDLPLVEKLVAQWEGQTERRPNARELDALIEGYIREEILVREAARRVVHARDRGQPIAPGAPRLLHVVLERARWVPVHHPAHVALVDALHTRRLERRVSRRAALAGGA